MRQIKALPFDEFVSEHAAGLMRTAYLITADSGGAEDLVQECFVELARRWPKVAKMDYPLAYARQVLVRLAVRSSKRRHRNRAELRAEVIETGATSPMLDELATREEVRVALAELAPRQRAVLVLRYFHDLTEAQVAEALGCTVGTVKSTTSRSLVQLRHRLQPPMTQQGARNDGRAA